MKIYPVNYPPSTSLLEPRPLRDITDFVIHHAAGPLDQTPLQIDAFERSRGDIYIPYNYIVSPRDYKVYEGRPVYVVGAATYGRNQHALAVCVLGNYQSDDPGYTGQPDNALIQLLIDLRVSCQQMAPYLERTYGHRDVAPLFFPQDQGDYSTACPGDTLYKRIPEIIDGARKQLVDEKVGP